LELEAAAALRVYMAGAGLAAAKPLWVFCEELERPPTTGQVQRGNFDSVRASRAFDAQKTLPYMTLYD
jgi:hypothetical protein